MQRIIQSAMELFWLKGYASTSIADILSRSQVNSGSLYYFFPGKQDVLLAVLEAYRDGIGPMLLRAGVGPCRRSCRTRVRVARAVSAPIVETECDLRLPHRQSRAWSCTTPTRLCATCWQQNFTAWVDAVEQCFRAAATASVRARTCAASPSLRSTSWKAE